MATRLGYTGHPLTWGRTDRGRPLRMVVLGLLLILAVGVAVAFLLSALVQVTPGAVSGAGGLVGGEGPLVAFMLIAFLGFIWPTNVMTIFLIGLPILGLILLKKKRGSANGAS